jgi:hypothetical protein
LLRRQVISYRPPCLLWFDPSTNLWCWVPVFFAHCFGPQNVILNPFLQMGRYRKIGRTLRNTSDVLHCVKSESVPSRNVIYYTALLYFYYHTFIMIFLEYFRHCSLCSFKAQCPDRVCPKLFLSNSNILTWKGSRVKWYMLNTQ